MGRKGMDILWKSKIIKIKCYICKVYPISTGLITKFLI